MFEYEAAQRMSELDIVMLYTWEKEMYGSVREEGMLADRRTNWILLCYIHGRRCMDL
jgi:hypothetical protein